MPVHSTQVSNFTVEQLREHATTPEKKKAVTKELQRRKHVREIKKLHKPLRSSTGKRIGKMIV